MEPASAGKATGTRYDAWWGWILGAAVACACLIGLTYIKWVEPLDVSIPRISMQVADPDIRGRALIDDEVQYLEIARSLAVGTGYRNEPGGEATAFRLPGYPLYVAALFKIFGASVGIALLGNMILVALLPLLAFALAKPVFGFKAAMVASIFCAFDPGLYYFGVSRALSEPLFALLLCSATVLWQMRSSSRHSRAVAFAAGALYAATSLTRTGYIGLPVLLILAEAVCNRSKLRREHVLALGLSFCLVMSTWAVRNWVAMGTPLFSSTNDGVTLLGTVLAAERGRGDWLNPADVAPRYAQVQHLPDEIERNRAARQIALSEARHISLATLLKVAAHRLLRLWVPLNRIVSDDLSMKANIAANLLYFPVVLLAGAGLWRARDAASIIPLVAPCLYATLLAAISWGGTRFRYGVEPILAAFAAYGLLRVVHRVRAYNSRPNPMVTGA